MEENQPITQLLDRWQAGKEEALNQVIPLVYEELRQIAKRSLSRERSNHTLHTVDLVNEAYLKLVGQNRTQWQNRAQFFGVAAQLMRRVLVDHARGVGTQKRGSGVQKIQIESQEFAEKRPCDWIVLEDALKDLEALDPMQCRIVEMRYFAGLPLKDIAEILDISLARTKREWQMVKAWLFQYLKDHQQGPLKSKG